MTIRYHARGGKDLPTYLCQRDGTGNARPICAALPGHTLDDRIGQLLTATLTPLAAEAALQVSAELEHRAAEADALRAAHVERARYHADLARRRYLAVDPASRCCPTLKIPTKAALAIPMKNRTIRAAWWVRCRATSARCRAGRRQRACRSGSGRGQGR
jgi:hypothetical protein